MSLTMKTAPTLEDGQALSGIVHIHRVSDTEWTCYEAVEELPSFLTDGLTDEQRAAQQGGI